MTSYLEGFSGLFLKDSRRIIPIKRQQIATMFPFSCGDIEKTEAEEPKTLANQQQKWLGETEQWKAQARTADSKMASERESKTTWLESPQQVWVSWAAITLTEAPRPVELEVFAHVLQASCLTDGTTGPCRCETHPCHGLKLETRTRS